MEMQSPETPVSSSPKSIVWIIVSIILAIVLIIFGVYFYTKSKVTALVETGIQNLELNMSAQDAETEKLTNERLLSKLSLSPKIYSDEESVLKKDFENPNLTSLSSGTQSFGENMLYTGNGNINFMTENFSLERKTDIYFKYITDTDASIFLFKKEQLEKFQNFDGKDLFNTVNVPQDPNNFRPIAPILSTYSQFNLEKGEYAVVIIPTKKALTVTSEMKIK